MPNDDKNWKPKRHSFMPLYRHHRFLICFILPVVCVLVERPYSTDEIQDFWEAFYLCFLNLVFKKQHKCWESFFILLRGTNVKFFDVYYCLPVEVVCVKVNRLIIVLDKCIGGLNRKQKTVLRQILFTPVVKGHGSNSRHSCCVSARTYKQWDRALVLRHARVVYNVAKVGRFHVGSQRFEERHVVQNPHRALIKKENAISSYYCLQVFIRFCTYFVNNASL